MYRTSLEYQGKCVETRAWPSTYEEKTVSEFSPCCRLHQRIELAKDGGVGCAALACGTHVSIRALYRDDTRYCHVELGVRVIDAELFSEIVVMNNAFIERAFMCGKRFKQRYCGGSPIGWLAYGAGYCYLMPVAGAVRSRVARCLGPLPLLADVVRFLLVFGDVDVRTLSIAETSSGVWHVAASESRKEGMSCAQLITKMTEIIRVCPGARVGLEEDEMIDDDSCVRGSFEMSDGECKELCFLVGVPTVVDESIEGDRVSRIRSPREIALSMWFHAKGLHVFPDVAVVLMTATEYVKIPTRVVSEKSPFHCWVEKGFDALSIGASYEVCSAAFVVDVTEESLENAFENCGLEEVSLLGAFDECSPGPLIMRAISGVLYEMSGVDAVGVFIQGLDLKWEMRAI